MLVKLTLKNGETIWVSMAHLVCLYGLAEGGSRLCMAHGLAYEIAETPQEFWDRMQGKGGIDVPGRRLVTP